MGVSTVTFGTVKIIDISDSTIKPETVAEGEKGYGADGEPFIGKLKIVTPKVHLDQGVMYAPATSAYYKVQTASNYSVNFNYYGGSGCEQIVYPITGLVVGRSYTIEFEETYNGGFIGDSYYYGCGIMQESEYNATEFPINAGKPSFVTWYTGNTGTQSGSITFVANTTKAYWVWSMARCQDGTIHNITFRVKTKACNLTLQDKTVTENGTITADYGYDGLGQVIVNIPTTDSTLQSKSVSITENGTHTIVPDNGYDGMSSVEVSVEVATSGGFSTLDYYNYNATTIGDMAYENLDVFKSVNYMSATSIGEYAFRNCNNLKSAKFLAATNVNDSAFYSCKGLTTVDFSAQVTFDSRAFHGCSELTAVILRSETMATLVDSSAFMFTPIQANGGYIYVPSALIDSYKFQGTYWWNFQESFRALEAYTVDGTTTGELDESKI